MGDDMVPLDGVFGDQGGDLQQVDEHYTENPGALSRLTSSLEFVLANQFRVGLKPPFRNITCTTLVREVNARGLDIVKKSISDKGWLNHLAPAECIDNETLHGHDLDGNSVESVEYKVLDGNHGITAVKKIWGGDKLVVYRIHGEFEPKKLKVIADRKLLCFYLQLPVF